jgi:hypothetical protein
MSHNPAFICLLLCNNDFSIELEQAARIIHENFGNKPFLCSEERVKRVVIKLIIGLHDLRYADRGFEVNCIKDYLEAQLSVKFTDKPLTLDHDGGSVAIDRNTGYIWLIRK